MYTLKQETSLEEKIQKSSFICHIKPVLTIDEAKVEIANIARQHKMATHNCWAYIIGKKGELSHCSDAGEPSGTAGKPILNALMKNEMSNIACVVTRYFGGIKLGVRGLIDAYGGITDRTCMTAECEEIIDFFFYQVRMGYDFFDTFKHRLLPEGLVITDTEYTTDIRLKIKIAETNNAKILQLLSEYKANRKLDFQTISE